MRSRTDAYGVEHYREVGMKLIPGDEPGEWRAIVWSSQMQREVHGPTVRGRTRAHELACEQRTDEEWEWRREHLREIPF